MSGSWKDIEKILSRFYFTHKKKDYLSYTIIFKLKQLTFGSMSQNNKSWRLREVISFFFSQNALCNPTILTAVRKLSLLCQKVQQVNSAKTCLKYLSNGPNPTGRREWGLVLGGVCLRTGRAGCNGRVDLNTTCQQPRRAKRVGKTNSPNRNQTGARGQIASRLLVRFSDVLKFEPLS